MTEQTDRDALMRRLQKLLAIAEDARTNPNEAASAAAMAERLMRKHQIEHADLIQKSFRDSAAFATEEVFAKMKSNQPSKRVPSWGQWLAVAVARLHDCEARSAWSVQHASGESSACVRLYGFAMDVKLASWTYNFLVGEVIRATQQFNREARRTKVDSNSFRTGFVTALIANLNRARAEKDAELAAGAETGRALVVAKSQALAEHFGEFRYNSKQSRSRVSADAFALGRERGSAVDVTRRAVGADASENLLQIGA